MARRPRAWRTRLPRHYNRVNSFQIVISYDSSRDSVTPHFVLHGMWPAYMETGQSGIRVTSVYTGRNRDVPNKPYCAPQDELRGNMVRYWYSLKQGMSNEDFWIHQWNKHGKCSRLGCTVYLREAINHAQRFLSRNGDRYLRNFMTRYNYTVGGCFDCRRFQRRLNAFIGCRVYVVFRRRGRQTYLKEIRILVDQQGHVLTYGTNYRTSYHLREKFVL